MDKRYVLVGAKPPKVMTTNPGGQLTASQGLINFVESNGGVIDVLDTTQSSFPIPPLKDRIKRGTFRVKQLWNRLNESNCDGVIIFSSSGFSFYERILLSLVCRLLRVPSIFFMRSGHFCNEVKSSFMKKSFARLLLKIPKVIGAQGQGWVDFYQELGVSKERTLIVRNWLSEDFPVTSESKVYQGNSKLKFIYVGWLVKEKGILQLLEATLELSKKYEFELHLIGGGTLENHCQNFVNKNSLQDNIYLHGWQDKANIIKMLQSSDIFILPSEAEGFPNSLLEAMAMGLPSICTNVGGVADSLKDHQNGYLLNDNSMSNIKGAMSSYLDQPQLIEPHSVEALKIFHEFHDQKQNCEILFNQLMKSKV